MSKDVTDKALRKLLQFYKNAKKNITNKILDAHKKGNNDFYLRQTLTQIERELDKLYNQNRTWFEEQSDLSFRRGFHQFSKEIGTAATVEGAINFVKMNSTAVEMLSQSAVSCIGDALRQVKANTKNVINKIGRRENDIIADVGIQSSAEALAEISPSSAREKIISRLVSEEIATVTYRNGAKVPVDVYASMVARTTTHEATATAKLIAAEQDGYDLVKMSTHYPTCKTCAQLQGRVYSISGKDKRFPALSEAFKRGYNIVHPNCRHVVNVWVEDMKTDEEISEAVKNSNKLFDIDPRSEKERELYAAQQKRVRVNQSRALDMFNDSDAPIYTHISSQQVYENMQTTKIGQEYLKYIESLPERIKFDYYKLSEVYGEQLGTSIVIYMQKCDTPERVARTIIHECTHYKYGIGQSQWAESVCFAHELMHKYNRKTLTVAEKRRIIKAVKEGYDDVKWRKGGFINGRRKSH